MYFKRPSFRKGGSTGIGQLTPNRQMYAGGGNIGGGTIAGSNLGTRTGFESIILQSSGLPYPDPPKSKYVNPFKIKGYPSSKGILEALKPTGLAKYPITTGVGATAAIGAIPAYLAYMNRPRTLEEKKVMQDYGPIDETFFQYDEYDADRKKARGVGEEISFKEALFKDPDTGLYPKIFGSTESRTKRAEIEKAKQEQDDIKTIIESDGPAGDQITMLSDEAKGAATEALLKSIEEKKKRVEPGSDDSSITLDPYEEIKNEKDFLSEMLKNEGLERGEVALIAAKAIGTEGSFKDKLDAAVALALPVVRRRNKEDKALTLTAYKAFKEKEAAQAKAGQDTIGMKDLKSQANLLKESGDPKYKDKSQREIMAVLISDKFKDTDSEGRKEILKGSAKTIKEDFENVLDAKRTLETYIKTKYTDKGKEINATDNKLIQLQQELADNVETFKLLGNYKEFADVFPTFAEAFKRLNLVEGGRVKRALGTPPTGEQIITTEAQTIGAETAEKPVLKLDYAQLRDRLPPEITDDVVQLLANSEEALQEFAYIQTQNDVDAFNLKYGVNLIIPPAPQTA